MIINPDKFQTIILDKKKSNLTNIPLTIDNQTIKPVPPVELLGIHLDVKLNQLHISNICRSAANQPNALIRLKKLFGLLCKKSLNHSCLNHLIIVFWFGYFLLLNLWTKLKVFKKERFDFYTMITQYLMKVY